MIDGIIGEGMIWLYMGTLGMSLVLGLVVKGS